MNRRERSGIRPRHVNLITASVVFAIIGLFGLMAVFLLYQRKAVLREADDLLLYDATLFARSLDATLEITDLALQKAAGEISGTGTGDRNALAEAAFTIPGAENMYLLDADGRVLESIFQRGTPSLPLDADILERIRAGVDSMCLILDAPAEGGNALVFIGVLRREPEVRMAAVLFTRFDVQESISSMTSGIRSTFRLIDEAGGVLYSNIDSGAGFPGRGMEVNVSLSKWPVTLHFFADRSEVLRPWNLIAAVQLSIVLIFIGLVTAMLFHGMALRRRAVQADRFEQELKVKEMLFREVHHRTKNNLTTVQSVLGFALRAVAGESGPAASALKSSIARIQSISLIHELLYRSASHAEIDIGRYVTKLVESVRELFGQETCVEVRIDVQPDILLPYETAMTCGMVINELVTNSFKYAFPDRACGTITIRVAGNPDGSLLFAVEDDGIGFDHGGTGGGRGIGMELVRMLADNLSSVLERTPNTPSGTRWRLKLPPGKAVAPAASEKT